MQRRIRSSLMPADMLCLQVCIQCNCYLESSYFNHLELGLLARSRPVNGSSRSDDSCLQGGIGIYGYMEYMRTLLARLIGFTWYPSSPFCGKRLADPTASVEHPLYPAQLLICLAFGMVGLSCMSNPIGIRIPISSFLHHSSLKRRTIVLGRLPFPSSLLPCSVARARSAKFDLVLMSLALRVITPLPRPVGYSSFSACPVAAILPVAVPAVKPAARRIGLDHLSIRRFA
jgi:hypothetical protein